MKLTLPGTTLVLRVFERVETSNKSFAVFDVGLGYTDSELCDSIAVGIGSSFIHPASDLTDEQKADILNNKAEGDTTPPPAEEAVIETAAVSVEETAPVVEVQAEKPLPVKRPIDKKISELSEDEILSMSFT